MNNRRNEYYNDRRYECGNYDIFVRERRGDYGRYDYHNYDKNTKKVSFVEIAGIIIGLALLFISFNM